MRAESQTACRKWKLTLPGKEGRTAHPAALICCVWGNCGLFLPSGDACRARWQAGGASDGGEAAILMDLAAADRSAIPISHDSSGASPLYALRFFPGGQEYFLNDILRAVNSRG